MNKVSKLLVMTIVILAVITLSVTVKAFSNADLIAYVTSDQTVNGETYKFSNDQKTAITNYLNAHPVSDEVAASVKEDIEEAKRQITATGATRADQISDEVQSKVMSLLKSAGSKIGVNVSFDTKNKTVTLKDKATGTNIVSGSYAAYVKSNASTPGSVGASQTSGRLVYTGANYILYAIPVLAIVAVATILVIRKRS
ncbi:MAG: hypothetical protein HFJ46_02905 [Clostridia bacterium]|nr:hypothetical protein [Clostridia bacterium]